MKVQKLWFLAQSYQSFPAKGKECHYCGKPNHFANVCRGKSKDSHKHQKSEKRKLLTPSTIKVLDHLPTLILNLKMMSMCILFAVNRLLGLMLKSLFRDIPLILWLTLAHVFDRKTYSKMVDVTLARTTTKAFPYNTSQPVHFVGKFQALVQTKKRSTVATFFCC